MSDKSNKPARRERKKSIAIETSCRVGGVALGFDDELAAALPLGPSGRHAGELLVKLDELLKTHNLQPADLDEVYVSVGPGSFTGLRVGITVARTLGQVIPSLKIVAVPAAAVVAENVATMPGGLGCEQDYVWENWKNWKNLGVLLAAKRATASYRECTVHATLFGRDETGAAEEVGEPVVAALAELLASWPRPLLLSGEGLEYVDVPPAEDIQLAHEDIRLPTVENLWRLGQRLARENRFTPYNQLLPIYARRPEAVRLWEKRQNGQ